MSDEASRYDPYTEFWLRVRPDFGEEESGIPMHAYLCTDCGTVVIDTAVHDRFHEKTLDRLTRHVSALLQHADRQDTAP